MAWVRVKGDKPALYNLDTFQAVFILKGQKGDWIIVGIPSAGRPESLLADGLPDLEAAENVLEEIESALDVINLGGE